MLTFLITEQLIGYRYIRNEIGNIARYRQYKACRFKCNKFEYLRNRKMVKKNILIPRSKPFLFAFLIVQEKRNRIFTICYVHQILLKFCELIQKRKQKLLQITLKTPTHHYNAIEKGFLILWLTDFYNYYKSVSRFLSTKM